MRLFALVLICVFAVSGYAYADDAKATSTTGAVFTHDTSIPALGDAYRDPSGLIWGDVVRQLNSIVNVSQPEAAEYCQKGGVRLPTKEEVEQLALYLGAYTADGYSPYQKDLIGVNVLPHLWEAQYIWTSSSDIKDSKLGYYFETHVGDVPTTTAMTDLPFRCVSR